MTPENIKTVGFDRLVKVVRLLKARGFNDHDAAAIVAEVANQLGEEKTPFGEFVDEMEREGRSHQ